MTTLSISSTREENGLLQAAQIIGGSLFIALCSQISIPLPFSVVPLTLQTFSILLLGAVFGPRKGALMVITYFAQILCGFPVLAGGNVNPLAFLGPRGGYILGYLVQAYCMGWLVEHSSRTSKELFLAGLFTCTIQLGLGACWLAQFVGLKAALWMGFTPFIPGEILKVLLVSTYVSKNNVKSCT